MVWAPLSGLIKPAVDQAAQGDRKTSVVTAAITRKRAASTIWTR
jgi:hypothetical protein